VIVKTSVVQADRILEWEAIGAALPCGNQTPPNALFLLISSQLEICTENGVLWMIRLPETLAASLLMRSFHINSPLYTGFLGTPVGDKENWAPVRLSPAWFSKSPEFHNCDLENKTTDQIYCGQPFRKSFHFS
jgi:hypothetical protein